MLRSSPGSNDRVEATTRSLVRSSLVCAILAVLIPAGLYALFGRQARRLEALADHGLITDAAVTGRRNGTTFYAYTVDGTAYSWSVRDGEAPMTVGETFAVTYLPEVPSFSRPGTGGSVAAAEAASNRRFAGKTVAGFFWFFAANSLIFQVSLRRLRATGRTEADDPPAYRTRLLLTGLLLVAPMLALVFGWHATEALRQNETIWPVVLGAVLGVGVLGGTVFYVLRGGIANATSRARAVLRWSVPLAIAIAMVRAFAWLLGR